ncbi:unnamed protein product, partial [Arabidopsis halleri]
DDVSFSFSQNSSIYLTKHPTFIKIFTDFAINFTHVYIFQLMYNFILLN